MSRSFHVRLLVATVSCGVLLTTKSTGTLTPAETLLGADVIRALDEEISGAAAKRYVQRLSTFHRVPASPGFHAAIEYIKSQAQQFGLADIEVETFPADGSTFFGTLRANRGWRVGGVS